MADLEFSLRLTADGDAFVGTVRVAKQEVEALGEAARAKAAPGTDEFRKQMREAETTGKLLADTIIQTTKVILNFANEAINLGDRMADLSLGTGKSIAELQAYGAIADKSGSDTRALLGTVDLVAKGMSKASEDTSKYARALDFFGVSMVDATGKTKSAEQVAHELAVAYTESEKTAYAQAAAQVALGANYAAQIPSLLALADKEKELNSLREYGALVDDNLAAASDRYNDSLVDAGSVMTAFGNEMARTLLPLLTSAAEWFVRSATSGGILEGAITLLGVAIDGVVFVFKGFMSLLISLDALVQIVGTSLGALLAIVSKPFSAAAIWGDLKRDIADINDKSNKALGDLWTSIDKVNKVAQPVVDRGSFFGGRGGKSTIKADADDVVDYAREIGNLETKIAGTERAFFGAEEKASAYETALAKINSDLLAGKVVTNDQIDAYLDTALAYDAAKKKLNDYNDSLKIGKDYVDAYWKDRKEYEAALQKRIDDTDKLIGKMRDHNDALLVEIGQIGMSTEERISNNAAIERAHILAQDLNDDQRDMLLALVDQREALELQREGIKNSQAAWQDFMQSATASTQAFITDVINGGWSNAFKNLWNNFKAWAIQALTEIAAKQVVLSITASLGLGASGGANAGGLGGIFDSIVGGSGIGGIVKDLAGGLGSLLTGSLSLGTALGNLGTIMPTFTTLLEAGVGVTEAASAALAGMGASIGAVIPVIGAVVAAGTLIYNFVKSKEGGPKEGGFATTGPVPGIGGVDSTGRWITPNTQDAAMVKAVNTLNTTFESILTSLGGSGSAVFAQGFSTDPRGTAPSNVHTGAWVNGVQVFDNPNGNVGRDEEALQQELATQGMRAVLAALKSSELPSVVADYLATIDVSTATLEQIDAALAHARELYEPIKALTEQVRKLPEEMAEGMVAAIGVSPEIDAQIAAWAAEVEAFEIELAAFKEASDAFFASAGKVQDALDRDPQAEAMNAWAQAHQTTFEKVGIAKDALAALLVEYDGSTAATDDLAIATNAYRDAQVQALSQVYALRDALLGPEGLFSQTQHTLDWALMSKSQQTQWLIDEAVRQVEILKTTTDPAQIEKLANTINKDLMQAFSLMSPEEQQAKHDYLKGILENAKNITEAQLDTSEQLITDAGTSSGNVITLAEQALTDAGQVWLDAGAKMDATAEKLKEAATDLKAAAAEAKAASANNVAASNTMAAAATTMETAANTPVPVEVTVNLETVSGP